MSPAAPAVAAVADDLSGAAELGGAGWRRGLAAEVHTQPGLEPASALVVVDTDTRARSRAEARERLLRAGAWLSERRPGLVYKKTDSVLRGWVRAELEALMEALALPRALLVPANPSHRRVVRDGRLLVAGRPVHETDFARDPCHPIGSSEVLAMLGREGSAPVALSPRGAGLPERGIAVGEAIERADLLAWARRLDGGTLAAGAAEFFDAVLETRGHALRAPGPRERAPAGARLLVSGTTSEPARRAMASARARGVPVLPIPEALFQNGGEATGESVQGWAERAARALEGAPLVAVYIGRAPAPGAGRAARLVEHLAELVGKVLERTPVGGVLLEGGATAAAVVRRQGWTRLAVRRELAPGVVELETGGPRAALVTVKPGSYAWPEEVWRS